MYLEEGKSISAVASALNVAARTLYDAMMLWRIPRRSSWATRIASSAVQNDIDEQTLRRMYLDEAKSLHRIAQELSVSSRCVSSALVRWGIPRRYVRATQPARGALPHTEADDRLLYQMYVVEGVSARAIAASFGVSPSTVYKRLSQLGIQRRQRAPGRMQPV